MDTFTAQLITLLILFLGNIVSGSFPSLLVKIVGFYLKTGEEWNRKLKLTSFMSYIAAGILISNTFIILLPQANHEFEKPKNYTHRYSGNFSVKNSPEHSEHNHESFPIPELAVLCGFFLAFLIQESAFYILPKFSRNSSGPRDLPDRFCTCAKRLTECSRTFKDVRPDQTLYGMEKKLMESGNVPSSTSAASNVLPEPDVTQKSDLLRSSVITQNIPNYGAVTNAAEPLPVDSPLPVMAPPVLLAEERRLIIEKHSETRDQNRFLISSTLIVIELSIQFIFLGMHLGLRTEHFNNRSYLSITYVQNFLLTFSAGSYLAAGNMEFSCLGLFISLLSTISPIGMIVAMVEKDSVERIPHSAIGIVLSVASGALLFSTFLEILRRKVSGHVAGLKKFFALILGASVMAALQYAVLTT